MKRIAVDADELTAYEAEQLAKWLAPPLFGGRQHDMMWSPSYGIGFVQWDPATGAIEALPVQ